MTTPLSEDEFRRDRVDRAEKDGVSELRFAEALENVRREFTAGLTTAGVQIGAVEKTLAEKINSVRLWGALALVGGQAAAAFITAWVRPGVAAPVAHAARAVSRFFLQ